MNYCSIEDAWGKPNKISEQFSNYMNEQQNTDNQQQSWMRGAEQTKTSNSNVIENFTLIEKDNKKLEKVRRHLDELHGCDEFLNHFRNCRKCYNRVRNAIKPKFTEQFEDLVDDNRESIVLILVGVAILLFFNLVNNVTKNN